MKDTYVKYAYIGKRGGVGEEEQSKILLQTATNKANLRRLSHRNRFAQTHEPLQPAIEINFNAAPSLPPLFRRWRYRNRKSKGLDVFPNVVKPS